MPTPAVSLTVVLPVRNAEPYIGAALTSLVHNARPDFEFVVVDDGSTDAHRGDHRRVPQRRCRRCRSCGTRPGGRAGRRPQRRARPRAAAATSPTSTATTGWRAAISPTSSTRSTGWVSTSSASTTCRTPPAAGCCTARREARHGVTLDPRSGILPVDRRTMVDYPYAWAGVYRRSLGDLLRFPAGLHTAEDRPWIWRLHREAASYAVVPLAGLFYRRQVANSLTQTGDRRQLDVFDAYEMVFDQLHGQPEWQQKACRQFLSIVAHHLTRLGAAAADAARRAGGPHPPRAGRAAPRAAARGAHDAGARRAAAPLPARRGAQGRAGMTQVFYASTLFGAATLVGRDRLRRLRPARRTSGC